ncbi:ribonuclease H-like domain-containing protein [Scheffersomyces xylosifermentans]|uniref:ribonuclease H-like domain-containing protein n=1 Tax=Scheffersomyces xylosifermentans TaxID=1304137 RepID=UPI00315D51B0
MAEASAFVSQNSSNTSASRKTSSYTPAKSSQSGSSSYTRSSNSGYSNSSSSLWRSSAQSSKPSTTSKGASSSGNSIWSSSDARYNISPSEYSSASASVRQPSSNAFGPKNYQSKLQSSEVSSYKAPPSKYKAGVRGAEKPKVKNVYVDGAARGNGKTDSAPAGYGVFYGYNDSRNSAVSLDTVDNIKNTKPTNQRAELHAIKHALTDIANDLDNNQDTKYNIVSDSQYSIKSLNEWSDKWVQNNWKNSNGEDVANRDIIESTLPILNYVNKNYNERKWGDIEFTHVKGHSGHPGNENADRLANLGADDMERNLRK